MIIYDAEPKHPRKNTFHRHDENVGEMVAARIDDEGRRCFHCSGPVSLPVIHWWGSGEREGDDAFLMFHPSCAVEFSLRLLRDVHEVEYATGVGVVFQQGAYR